MMGIELIAVQVMVFSGLNITAVMISANPDKETASVLSYLTFCLAQL